LTNFKAQTTRVLVATDIAARGIDIDELSHVINFELPNVPETYVHRIGRTGRAGAKGISISFCDEEEKDYLKDIQKLIGKTIPVVTDQPYPMTAGGIKNPRISPPLRQPQHNNRRGNDSSSHRRSSSSPQRAGGQSNGGQSSNNRRPSGNSGRPNRNSGRPSSSGSSNGNSRSNGGWGSEDRDRNY
jgi:ATP-dependent RNA helicase RhlE